MKNLKKKITSTFAAILVALLLGHVATAQVQQAPTVKPREDFKKEELQSFVKANQKIVSIQQENEPKMIKIVKDEGFTVERFNEIASAQQQPEKKIEADEEEMASFNNVAKKLTTIGQEMNVQMEKSIQQEGLDVDTYQQIAAAYQQSDKVRKELDALLPKAGNP